VGYSGLAYHLNGWGARNASNLLVILFSRSLVAYSITDQPNHLDLYRDSYANLLDLNDLMANESTFKHSKTLGKMRNLNLSTLVPSALGRA
jgi:hypothetical protein